MLTGMIAQRLEQRFTVSRLATTLDERDLLVLSYIKSAFWDSNGADCAAEAV